MGGGAGDNSDSVNIATNVDTELEISQKDAGVTTKTEDITRKVWIGQKRFGGGTNGFV